jgi:hypothetical protein
VAWLNKSTMRRVRLIAEAYYLAEQEAQPMFCIGSEVVGPFYQALSLAVRAAFREGWFSSFDECLCDAGGLFARGNMCERCRAMHVQLQRFAVHDRNSVVSQ